MDDDFLAGPTRFGSAALPPAEAMTAPVPFGVTRMPPLVI